jgi:hypothetical protein
MVDRAYEENMDRSYSSPIHNYDCDNDESGGKDDERRHHVDTRLRSYRILVTRVLRHKLDLVLVETNIKDKCSPAALASSLCTTTKPGSHNNTNSSR